MFETNAHNYVKLNGVVYFKYALSLKSVFGIMF